MQICISYIFFTSLNNIENYIYEMDLFFEQIISNNKHWRYVVFVLKALLNNLLKITDWLAGLLLPNFLALICYRTYHSRV
jgi:hypothetical protein